MPFFRKKKFRPGSGFFHACFPQKEVHSKNGSFQAIILQEKSRIEDESFRTCRSFFPKEKIRFEGRPCQIR